MATEPNISLNVITNDNVTPLGERSSGKADPAIIDTKTSPGAMLQQAREGKNVSRDEVSDRLRLQPWIVEALENDDYSKMAAPTYVRGYLRNYAAHLDLPVAEVLARYDERRADKPAAAAIAKKTVKAGATAADNDGPSRHAPAIGFVLLVGIVGLFAAWWVALPQESTGGQLADFAASESSGTVISDAPVAGEGVAAGQNAAATVAERSVAESQVDGASGNDDLVAGSNEAGPASAGPEGLAAEGLVATELSSESPQSATASDVASDLSADELAAAEAEAAFERALAGNDVTDLGNNRSAVPTAAVDTPNVAVANADSSANDALVAPENIEILPVTVGSSGEVGVISSADTADTASYIDPNTQSASRALGYYGSSTAAVDGQSGLSLYFQQDSWAEVRDSRGNQLIYRLGESGSLTEVRGYPPFRVFLGNSPGVEVQLDGAAYDTARHVRPNNTARFQVGVDS